VDTEERKKETTEKEKKKREDRAKKREAKAAAKAAATAASTPAPTTLPAAKGPPEQEKTKAAAASAVPKMVLPEALVNAIPLLVPHTALDIVRSLAKEHPPTPPDARSPEEIMAKLLGGKGPVSQAAKKAELENDIKKMNAGIAALASGGDAVTEAVAGLTEKREAAEAALAKLSKVTPTQVHELKAVQEAKASFELQVQARKDREARGQANSQERHAERAKSIQDIKDQTVLLEAGLIQLEKENNEAHAKKVAEMDDLDLEVLKLLDAKVQGLQAAPQVHVAGPGLQPVGQVPPLLALAGPSQSNPANDLAMANKKIAELEARLNHGKDPNIVEFEREHTIKESQLPVVKVPEAKHIAAVAALFEIMNSWSLAGASSPFQWEAIDPVVGDALDIIMITKELIGATWSKWYDADPPKTAVVPRQVALLLLHCLTAIKKEFESVDKAESSKAALEGLEKLHQSTKRLRTA